MTKGAPERPHRDDEPVAGLVLAAGLGTRMSGANKPLLDLGGAPFVAHVLKAAAAGGLEPLWVVVGETADEIERKLEAEGLHPRIVANPAPRTGIAGSVRLGVEAIAASDPRIGALAVLLADEPGLRAEAIREVVSRWRVDRPDMVRARYTDRPGHPVVVDRVAWHRFRGLSGDAGLGASRESGMPEVSIPFPAPVDVDDGEAYREVLARLRHTDP